MLLKLKEDAEVFFSQGRPGTTQEHGHHQDLHEDHSLEKQLGKSLNPFVEAPGPHEGQLLYITKLWGQLPWCPIEEYPVGTQGYIHSVQVTAAQGPSVTDGAWPLSSGGHIPLFLRLRRGCGGREHLRMKTLLS